ncbi:MAG: YdcF family protein, partial [Candidatus Sericytochromatia bacterium]|nr:YdcF family protein [Candidatus Tanganyikabacteria bacterium]
MYALSKILPLFVLPLGVTMMLLVAGVMFRRRWLIIMAIVVLWASSTPIVARPLFAAIEGNQVRIPAVEAVPADAIVVLSSGRIVAPGPAAISEWQDADRFFAGLELFKAGKAPLLVFTGGWSP